ncbi:hypothetical protein AVEN_4678-1 [Araneus ventricosus]|uniref:Uncharacterized protein n=1 Tax=Araneus ventricosus TaxID=182803 RepID=A0A4Y2LL97_ARAVE|nr:hypothetical protein AVEN_4678-1 [Araneus ventricosus]
MLAKKWEWDESIDSTEKTIEGTKKKKTINWDLDGKDWFLLEKVSKLYLLLDVELLATFEPYYIVGWVVPYGDRKFSQFKASVEKFHEEKGNFENLLYDDVAMPSGPGAFLLIDDG